MTLCLLLSILNRLGREPVTYCKGGRKVIFTIPFLILGKVTLNKYVNVLAKVIVKVIYHTYLQNFNGSLSKIKGLISQRSTINLLACMPLF